MRFKYNIEKCAWAGCPPSRKPAFLQNLGTDAPCSTQTSPLPRPLPGACCPTLWSVPRCLSSVPMNGPTSDLLPWNPPFRSHPPRPSSGSHEAPPENGPQRHSLTAYAALPPAHPAGRSAGHCSGCATPTQGPLPPGRTPPGRTARAGTQESHSASCAWHLSASAPVL